MPASTETRYSCPSNACGHIADSPNTLAEHGRFHHSSPSPFGTTLITRVQAVKLSTMEDLEVEAWCILLSDNKIHFTQQVRAQICIAQSEGDTVYTL